MSQTVLLSATRALKNRTLLLSQAPELVDPTQAKAHGVEVLTDKQLRFVHMSGRVPNLGLTPAQLLALSKVKFPPLVLDVKHPLFSGTMHIAQIYFQVNGLTTPVNLSNQDIQTAISYATLAAPQISHYASQYGPHDITVSQTPLIAPLQVGSKNYNNGDLVDWINAIYKDAKLPANDCICFLNPPSMTNTDAPPTIYGGFHSKADCPYIFVNVGGSGFTIDDQAGDYAMALSHEMAETVVDPNVGTGNPEVCDPCAGNCDNFIADYFNQSSQYIGSNRGTPYYFFISSIVQPGSATVCPAPASACAYWPEIWTSLGGPNLQQIAVANDHTGQTEVFGLGKDGAVYNASENGAVWSAWTSLLGDKLKQIAVTSGFASALELFAVGGDSTVYMMSQDTSTYIWGAWQTTGIKNVSQIAVASNSAGASVLLALDKSGAVSANVQTQGNWSGWQPLNGQDLKQVLISATTAGEFVAIALGGDSNAYYRIRSASGQWTAWSGIAGVQFTQLAAGSDDKGNLQLFGLGKDQAIWVSILAVNIGTWSGWSTLQGSKLQSVEVGQNADGRLELFVVGGDALTYHIWQTPPQNVWGTWTGLGATQLVQFSQVVPINSQGKLKLFGLAKDSTVYFISQVAPNGGWD